MPRAHLCEAWFTRPQLQGEEAIGTAYSFDAAHVAQSFFSSALRRTSPCVAMAGQREHFFTLACTPHCEVLHALQRVGAAPGDVQNVLSFASQLEHALVIVFASLENPRLDLGPVDCFRLVPLGSFDSTESVLSSSV